MNKKKSKFLIKLPKFIFLLIGVFFLLPHFASAATLTLPFTDSSGTYTDAIASLRDGDYTIVYFNSDSTLCTGSCFGTQTTTLVGTLGHLVTWNNSGFWAVQFAAHDIDGTSPNKISSYDCTDSGYTSCTGGGPGTSYLNAPPTTTLDFSSMDVYNPSGTLLVTGSGSGSIDTSTHFISFSPTWGTTTPSNTFTLQSQYYINPSDASTSCTYFDVSASGGVGVPDCQYSVSIVLKNLDDSSQPQFHKSFFTIAGFTLTSSSTETLPTGFYTGSWDIFYGNRAIAATTTRFAVVGTYLNSTTTDELLGKHSSISGGSISSESACSGLGFLTFACWRTLFILTPDDQSELNDHVTVVFFDKVPFSYVVRLQNILNATTTTSLPTISFTFPTTTALATTLGGDTFHFNPWAYGFDTATSAVNSMTDPETGKNVWQILQVPFETIVYMMLILLIINDLLHIHPAHHGLEHQQDYQPQDQNK